MGKAMDSPFRWRQGWYFCWDSVWMKELKGLSRIIVLGMFDPSVRDGEKDLAES
jgi:hypothetical protein